LLLLDQILSPMNRLLPVVLLLLIGHAVLASQYSSSIRIGAEQTDLYLPLLKRKSVAIVANHSTVIGQTHLVDSLIRAGCRIVKIFCPEHGFRGDVEAGELIGNSIDEKTGLPVISLYGSHKKPYPKDLRGIDIVVFDMQDVGVRYYTYISTMHYVMEACAEHGVPLIVLDRPNPNGFYVDGPVLDTAYRSFVGMHPVPLVHGMTVGEFARMINGEGWLKNGIKCELTVIPCSGYDHRMVYTLPVKPSPNLPNQTAILLYPSLGFFEGTVISVGRGTDFPFQLFGHPQLPPTGFSFTPEEKKGASKNPPFKGEVCYGFDLRDYSADYFIDRREVNLEWLIFAYKMIKDRTAFFNSFFTNLAGTRELRKQIELGMDNDAIHSSWRQELGDFKRMRKKYLLYPDFE